MQKYETAVEFLEDDDFDAQALPDLNEVFDAGGLLSIKLKNYFPREGQKEMAKAVQNAFANGKILISEAGTGTGKTYAYLIPALLARKKVVISTGTKALQDQLIKYDVPKLLSLLKLKTPYTVLKGFNNYLCRKKLDDIRYGNVLAPKTINYVKAIESDAIINKDNDNADFAEINSKLPLKITELLTCSRAQCAGKDCPYYPDECFALMARRRSQKSQVVIINHSLFFASRETDKNPNKSMHLLPDFDALVFDEAHAIPDACRSYYSCSVSHRGFMQFTEDFLAVLRDIDFEGIEAFNTLFVKLNTASRELLDMLRPYKGSNDIRLLKYLNFTADGDYSELKVNPLFRNKMGEIYLALKDIAKLIKSNAESNPDRFEKLTETVNEMMDTVVAVMTFDRNKDGTKKDSNYVAFSECSEKNYILTISPLDVGGALKNEFSALLEKGTGIVMTSATVSVNNDFTKFIYDAGCADLDPETLIVPSIFDYAKNSRLFVSEAFPDSNDDERIVKIINMLMPAIEEVRGGVFFLTTSYKALKEADSILREKLKDKRRVLCQASGKSNFAMMDEFKKDGNAVLIGTSSFWEGVDVPGKALSLVIIDKLPFAPPNDPIYQARAEKCRNKGIEPFVNISLPEAVITLRQGVGRLIRQENDTGAMVICDPRLIARNYGRLFLSSLPPMRRCKDISDLMSFLKAQD